MNSDHIDHERLAKETVQALTPASVPSGAMDPAERLALVKALLQARKVPRCKNPMRRPSLYYPGLPSRPIYDATAFPWAARILSHVPDFVAELSALERSDARQRAFHTVWPEFTKNGEWAAVWLRLYGEAYDENASRCPHTMTAIEQIPYQAGWLGFSATAPHTHIAPHCGFTNAKLRCHVPLELPATGSRIRVADAIYEWKPLEMLVFDDSFEHEVWNDSDARRVVLIFDIFHPDLSPDEVAFLSAFEQQTIKPIYTKLMQRYREGSSDVAWMYDGAADLVTTTRQDSPGS